MLHNLSDSSLSCLVSFPPEDETTDLFYYNTNIEYKNMNTN